MKRTLTALLMTFGLGSMFVATPISAQNNPATADVPFSFVASGKTLPAGKYNISQTRSGSATFRLEDEKGEAIMTQLGVREDGNPSHPSVTFLRSGGEWVLVKVTPPNSSAAYSVGNSQYKSQNMHLAAMVSVNLK
jgi:hypothetical protein